MVLHALDVPVARVVAVVLAAVDVLAVRVAQVVPAVRDVADAADVVAVAEGAADVKSSVYQKHFLNRFSPYPL
ncbi:hypothetical protein LD39_09270 [Halobacillus sp. BBL2006]|nr:hypothetical protein LD39_09270 [Halobacillus sp. BBL2006]